MHESEKILETLTVLVERQHRHHNEQMGLLERLERKIDIMAETQAQVVADLKNLTAQVAKIGTETTATLQKVTDLQAIIDAGGGVGGTVTQEVQDALDALKTQVQVVDDLTPDAPAAPVA